MDKKLLRKAFEHGKTVGTYTMSTLPTKYAPLTFEGWYTNLKLREKRDYKKELVGLMSKTSDTAEFLIKNKFIQSKSHPNQFTNKGCTINITGKGYTVQFNIGDEVYSMYSLDFSIYWLIGLLVYYKWIDEPIQR